LPWILVFGFENNEVMAKEYYDWEGKIHLRVKKVWQVF
jgi:hypothetical protein